jgi:site-specific DNA-methyltransferase (adenine-specific)
MKIIPDKSIDMILCDLPYGTTACKWDVIIPFEPFCSLLRMSNFNNYKYDWIWQKTRHTNFLHAKHMPMNIYENIMIFTNNGAVLNYHPQMRKGGKHSQNTTIHKEIYHKNKKVDGNVYKESDEFYPLNIITFAKEYDGYHPTQKPIPLLEYLIKTYTNEGMVVLDNCMGSGSTKIACINTNRKFIGIEKDEKYFEIAKNRKPGDKKEVIKTNKNIGLFE